MSIPSLFFFSIVFLFSGSVPALPESSVSYEAEYNAIRAAAGAADFRTAANRCRNLLERFPTHLNLYQTLVELSVYCGTVEETDRFFADRFGQGILPAQALFGRGCVSLHRGSYDDAEECFQRALDLGEVSLEVYANWELAREKADGVEKAVAIITAECHQSPRNAGLWYSLALAHWSELNAAKALRAVREALRFRPGESKLEQLLTVVQCYDMPSQQSIMKAESLLAHAEQSADHDGAGFLRWCIVDTHQKLGHVDASRISLKSALARTTQFGQYRWRGHICLAISGEALSKGDIEKARQYADSAHEAFRLVGDVDGMSSSQELLVGSLLEAGRHTEALYALVNSPSIAEGSIGDGVKLKVLLVLARAFADLGGFRLALAYSIQAEQLLRLYPDYHLERTRLFTVLGLIHQGLGNISLARIYLVEAYREARKTIPADRALSVCEGNIGLLDLASGHSSRAIGAFKRQLARSRRSCSYTEEASALSNIGLWHLKEGNMGKAQELFASALATTQITEHSVTGFGSLEGLAAVAERLGHHSDAKKYYGQLAKETAYLYRNRLLITLCTEAYQATEQKVVRIVQALCRLGLSRDGLETLEEMRDRLFPHAAFRQSYNVHGNTGWKVDSLLTLQRKAYANIQRDLSTMESSPSPMGLLGHIRHLQVYLSTGVALEDVESSPQPLETVRRVQTNYLKPGEALWDFAVGEKGTEAFLVTQDTLVHCSLPLGIRGWEDILGKAITGVHVTSGSGVRRRYRTSVNSQGVQELSQMLLRPFEKVLIDINELIVVPDGPLRNLPFEILGPGVNGYLLHSHTVSYLPVLPYRHGRWTRRAPVAFERVVAFADPQCGPSELASGPDVVSYTKLHGRNDTIWVSLPKSRDEVRILREIFGNRLESFLGIDATEWIFCEKAWRANLLHIGSHAGAGDRRGSGLFLQMVAGRGEDGRIHGYEILRQEYEANLVVLAGCNTDLSDEFLGVDGLSTAFLSSGAESVIAARWEVSDGATAELFESFYGNIGKGMSKSSALQMAKVHLIKSGWSNPAEWGAYILLGDRGQYNTRTSSSAISRSDPSASALLIVLVLIMLWLGVKYLREAGQRSPKTPV